MSWVKSLALGIAFMMAIPGATARAANYSETLHGDLSDNRLSPTEIPLGLGSNKIAGTFGSKPSPLGTHDLDYFKFTVPSGQRIQLILDSIEVGGANSFLGVANGSIFPISDTSTDPSPLLGWSHVFNYQVGTNLIPAMVSDSYLTAGTYSFWINETDLTAAHAFQLDVVASYVPEPGSIAALSAWGTLALLRRRRR